MAWNRPTSNAVGATSSSRPSGRGKMPRLRRGLIAGAIVVLGAGLAAWLLTNGEAASSPLQKKDRGLIKEAASAVSEEDDSRAEPDARIVSFKKEINDQVKEFIRRPATNIINWITKPLDPNDPDNALRTSIARDIQTLLAIRPGEPVPRQIPFGFMFDEVAMNMEAADGAAVVELRDGNAKFLEEMKKWKVALKEGDSKGKLQAKQNLIDAQLDLLSGLDEGISVNDSIKAAYEFRVKAAEFRKNLVTSIRELQTDDPSDVEAVKAMVKHANEQLDREGFVRIGMDEIIEGYEEEEEEDNGNQP